MGKDELRKKNKVQECFGHTKYMKSHGVVYFVRPLSCKFLLCTVLNCTLSLAVKYTGFPICKCFRCLFTSKGGSYWYFALARSQMMVYLDMAVPGRVTLKLIVKMR